MPPWMGDKVLLMAGDEGDGGSREGARKRDRQGVPVCVWEDNVGVLSLCFPNYLSVSSRI